MTSITAQEIDAALIHLQRRDRHMKRVIQQVGPFRMKRQTNRYQALLNAIVSQQISTASARAIWGRLELLTEAGGLSASTVHALADEQLRGAGLSPQKIRYVRDLTNRIHRGELRLAGMHRRVDDEVIAALTEVLGIGVWTAQMFLMFSLGRPDVLPHGDLGIQSAMRNIYQLEELPDREACIRIAEPWRPYTTVACWYLWRSLALKQS